MRLFVPLLLRGPLTDLCQTWWVYVGGPRNCPWGVLFWKAQRVNGSNVTFSEQTTPGWDHTTAKGVPSKRHTASKSLIPSTGIFTSSVEFTYVYFFNFFFKGTVVDNHYGKFIHDNICTQMHIYAYRQTHAYSHSFTLTYSKSYNSRMFMVKQYGGQNKEEAGGGARSSSEKGAGSPGGPTCPTRGCTCPTWLLVPTI